MEKDNYTLEELTDLLQTQVMLTLTNDGEFYKKAYIYIEACDYRAFSNATVARIRYVAQEVVPDADFMPATRSLVLIWDYYMKNVYPRPAVSDLYVSDMQRITVNNNEMLTKPKDKQPDPGKGFVLITPDQACDLKFTAEYYDDRNDEWRSCRSCAFRPAFAYRAPAHVMQQLSPLPPTSPETPKEITMSTVTNSFDASTPVTNVTLIYGKPAKNYSESDLLACVRRLDADIETYTKSDIPSARITAKVATMRAERAQIILAFDAAGDAAVGTTSDATTV